MLHLAGRTLHDDGAFLAYSGNKPVCELLFFLFYDRVCTLSETASTPHLHFVATVHECLWVAFGVSWMIREVLAVPPSPSQPPVDEVLSDRIAKKKSLSDGVLARDRSLPRGDVAGCECRSHIVAKYGP